MLVITGIFDNGRFIPDKPVSIPEKTKVKIVIEEEKSLEVKLPKITMAQVEKWSKAPEIQSLVGVLKNVNLPADITIKDIRNERLKGKYEE